MIGTIHAWYSQKQFNNLNSFKDSDKHKRPYIYYQKPCGEIVQITEVSHTSDQYPSKFDDAVYLGIVSKFYKISETPIKIENKNN